jgi:DNA-binding NarL/FixJ family response regulator
VGGRCEPLLQDASLEDVSPVTVLLAVSDQLQKAVLLRAMRRHDDLTIVGAEHDGARALDAILRTAPDVAVVDAGLSSVDGLDLCARIAEARPEVGTRVLLLEGDPPVTRDLAVASGAAGCLPATATTAQVCDAVTSIANGGAIFHI